eukprot:TRINITY_DN54315_c0_g1_i1.p2 TRINITY_DN54315_c0_g1~~TRINITY_DN54315_c0_g1_i1.p2  ORF type:complete len:114 (-),score=40.95 TRINITY_DN54315_c0_g1_i1:110-451(-)
MFLCFFFSSRRRHTRCREVSWARRCVQETVSTQSTWVFEQFMKYTLNKKKLHRGTGIGLAICKKTTELMGGKIWLESELNVGTTVFFQFPTLQMTEFCKIKISNQLTLSLIHI